MFAIDFDISSSDFYNFVESTFVAPGVFVEAPSLNVTKSMLLDNNGTIVGNINVCDDCVLDIKNSGVMDTTFTLGDNAKVNQIISDDMDIVSVDFDTEFDVVVRDYSGDKTLADIVSVSGNANKINITDSTIVWNVKDIDISNIEIGKNVILDVGSANELIGVPLVNNLSDMSQVSVVAESDNPMFVPHAFINNNVLFVDLVRQTDYTQFMDYKFGNYINTLRENGDAGFLLEALDSAKSMNAIDEIMADSVRIAPIKMMDIVRVFNLFDSDVFGDEIGASASYVSAGDVALYGGGANASYRFSDLEIGTNVYLNLVDGADNYDEYSGKMFGGKIYAKYNIDNIILRAMIGGNITLFNLDNVFDGEKSVDNPRGKSGYGAMDFGVRLYDDNGIYAAGFFGLYHGRVSMLDNKVADTFGRISSEIGYTHEIMGVHYSYGLNLGITTDADLSFGIRAGYMSIIDMIGAHVSVGFIDNKIGRGYKIAAGMDFKF